MELGQIAPVYLYELSQYQKGAHATKSLVEKMQGIVRMRKRCWMYLHFN